MTSFILLLVLVAGAPQLTRSRVVNVAIYGPFTDMEGEDRTAYPPERYVSRVAGAVRAFQDVNNRDGTILPALASTVAPCPVVYRYHLVDSISSFGTAIQQYFNLREGLEKVGQTVDAIVGG